MNRQESRQEYVDRVVAGFSPLTPEQRDKIAGLLRPAGGENRNG